MFVKGDSNVSEDKKRSNGEVRLSNREENELKTIIDHQINFYKAINDVLINQYERLNMDTILTELYT